MVNLLNSQSASGVLELQNARVRWFLSVDFETLPKEGKNENKRTYRLIYIDGKAVEFSDGFTDLHTESYRNILEGNGFGLREARDSIELVHQIRNAEIIGLKGDYHPFCQKVLG